MSNTATFKASLVVLTNPQVVEVVDNLLELDGDVDVDVLVEAGLDGDERGQGRPVVGAGCKERNILQSQIVVRNAGVSSETYALAVHFAHYS